MSLDAPIPQWLPGVSIVLILAIVRWRCVELAETYTRLVFSLCSLGLSAPAKQAWRNEALFYLLERMWDDLKAAQRREIVAANGAFRATNLLLAGFGERAYYVEASRRGGLADVVPETRKDDSPWTLSVDVDTLESAGEALLLTRSFIHDGHAAEYVLIEYDSASELWEDVRAGKVGHDFAVYELDPGRSTVPRRKTSHVRALLRPSSEDDGSMRRPNRTDF